MNKIKLMEILARIPLFKDLTPPEREVVQNMIRNIKRYPQGKVFIKEGAHEPFFYIILAGKAEVSHRAHKIGELIPGQFIGEVGFICKEPRSATVTASTDIALMLINAEDFRRLPARIRESIKDRIISGLVERVSGMNDNTIRYEDEIDELKEKVDEYENDPRFKGRGSVLSEEEEAATKSGTEATKRGKNKGWRNRKIAQRMAEQESKSKQASSNDATDIVQASAEEKADTEVITDDESVDPNEQISTQSSDKDTENHSEKGRSAYGE